MGGYGSGRPGARTAVEDALRIDLASPAVRKVFMPDTYQRGAWSWLRDSERIASLGYEADVTGDEARLTLAYTANGVSVRQSISLVQTRPRFGGWRWWFVCPLLFDRGERRLVRAIFLPPGARYFGSRVGHGLNYQSQKESRSFPRLIEGLLRDYA